MLRVEAAQATVEQVKVDRIDTNLAVTKELLFPAIGLSAHVQLLASWKDPFKSSVFLGFTSHAILRCKEDAILVSPVGQLITSCYEPET
ncbi:hypothetical protein SLEP1_g22375 [Rubroshorea leprosula]|uniref:Uncharacterized protein n=1 Tax=Rubroshorea leprosula TaxID=152421 RepID=A0AAV5JG97_9ROSI|nr:hypothetical protein SLEP1_g22375 [Rubroshorea leprosula]